MVAILVDALTPRAGKTTVIAGLAQNLRGRAGPVAAVRLHAGDPLQEGPQLDARFYPLSTFISGSTPRPLSVEQAAELVASAPPERLIFVENDSGLPGDEVARAINARLLLVATPESHLMAAASAREVVGVLMNKVPERRFEEGRDAFARANVTGLGMIPEDTLLASFTVGQLHDSLKADVLVEGDFDSVIENVVIGPVSADPGRDYFSRFPSNAVITRSHKPDLLLAALDAGTNCLIIAGGRPPLEYVIDRAQSYEVPVLLTMNNTFETARALEGVYSSARFHGQRKVARIAELIAANIPIEPLAQALGLS